MWSYQVETARNSARALWRIQPPKMTSTSLTLPRNRGNSVRRRRIFRVVDRWSLVIFQIFLSYTSKYFLCLIYCVVFICQLFFNVQAFFTGLRIKPAVTCTFSLFCLFTALHSRFRTFRYISICLILNLFRSEKYTARACQPKLYLAGILPFSGNHADFGIDSETFHPDIMHRHFSVLNNTDLKISRLKNKNV